MISLAHIHGCSLVIFRQPSPNGGGVAIPLQVRHALFLLLVMVATSTGCLSEQVGLFSPRTQEAFKWLWLASFILLVLGAIVTILLPRKKLRHVVGSIVVGAGISFLVFFVLA